MLDSWNDGPTKPALGSVRPVAFDHQAIVESQHLTHQTVVLVAVGDDDGVDALVDTFDGEPKIRNARQRLGLLGPVLAQRRLAANDPVRVRQELGGHG